MVLKIAIQIIETLLELRPLLIESLEVVLKLFQSLSDPSEQELILTVIII